MLEGDGELLAAVLDVREALHRHEERLKKQQEVLDRLSDLVTENRPTLEEIRRVVSDYFGLAQAEIAGRSKQTAHARLVIYYLARRMTNLSFQNIADRLGRRHHSTVMIGSERLARKARGDEMLFFELESIRVRISEIVTNRVRQIGR